MKTLKFDINTDYSNAVKGYRSLGLLVTYKMIKENEEYVVVIEDKAWEEKYIYVFIGIFLGILFSCLVFYVVNH